MGEAGCHSSQHDLQNLLPWSLATQTVVLGTVASESLLEVKTLKKECVCVCIYTHTHTHIYMAELLCYTAEIDTTL